MIRARKLFTIVVPSLLAGGLLFGSSFGVADVTVTRNGKTIVIPTPPEAPTPPTPPTPPSDPWGNGSPGRHQRHQRHGMSVQIHDGKVQIDGLKEMVADQLANARRSIENNQAIPPDVRARVLERLDRVNGIVDRRISRIKATDLDQLGEELGKMGEELGKAMDGLGEDLSKLGDQIGKDVAKQIGKQFKHFNPAVAHADPDSDDSQGNSDSDSDSDNDNDHDNDQSAVPAVPSMDPDDDNDRAAIAKLGNLQLEPRQRAMIAQLRADTDRRVGEAKKEIDRLSETLRVALDNPASSEAEVGRYVDQISAQEAVIRKARINSWMSARRVLSDDQRAKVLSAAARKTP
jgi:hypothetical protein